MHLHTLRTGLRESHAHVAMLGRELSALALHDCTSRGEALDRIASEVARLREAREPAWLVAAGVRVAAWDQPHWPTMEELDALCPDRACFVRGFDYHSCAVNRQAFERAGLRDSSPNPPGGVICRGGGGSPTGLLLEAAYGLVRDAVPEPTPDQWKRMLRLGLSTLTSHGFAAVDDLLSQPWLGPMLAEMHDAGELPLRVRLYAPWDRIGEESEAARVYSRPGRVELGGGKAFADGTLNSRTAWMLEPYRDPLPGHPCGSALMPEPALRSAMRACAGVGTSLAVHAIGDAAVRAVLNARETTPGANVRLEHAEVIDAADVPRFAALGVTCSVQPCHLLCDEEVLRRQLPDRLDRVLPLRDLLASGLVPGRGLVFGSDAPIVRPDPGDSVVAATLRRRADSPAGSAIAPAQAIPEESAWACFATPRPA
jgi:predicted amidohydrolase YtcJ